MQTTQLGRTGLQVSRVGFGGIPIQRLDEDAFERLIRRAVQLGVTFFDTANGYGTSEDRFGQALEPHRESVILATKTMARGATEARQHLELSLRRLRTDYVDLWQFHSVNSDDDYEAILGPGGAMEVAQEGLRSGTVRHIGLTSHSLEIALKATASGHFETIQFPYNFVTNEAEERLIPLAAEQDVGFIGMKPFAGGMLSKASLSIKYVLQHDGVVPDPGFETIDEIEEIAQIVAGPWELTQEEREEIAEIRRTVGNRFCRRCGYCLPCPQEIRIPTALNVKSFAKRFPKERLFSGSVGQAAEKAQDCVKCGVCETRCPYGLPIREMLEDVVLYYQELKAAQ